MVKKLDKIFNECVERIILGESIQDCLKRYPGRAAELEPLLRTAFDVSRRASSLRPRRVFKAIARARIEGAQQYARYVQQQPAKVGFFTLQRAWVPALTAFLVLLFSSAGTVAASSDALPDQPLYPVKLAAEQVRLTFTFSDVSKAKFNVYLAENRSQEIVAMAALGKTEQIVTVTEKLANHLEEADLAIKRVEEAEAGQFFSIPEMPTTPELVPTPEPEPAPEPVSEPGPAAEPEPAPEPVSEPVLAPEPEPAPEPVSEPGPAVEPEPAPEPVSEPVLAPERKPAPEPEPSPEDVPAVEPKQVPESGPATKIRKSEEIVPDSEQEEVTESKRLKKSFKMSISRNLAAFERALGGAPEQVKPALRHAIELSERRYKQAQQGAKSEDTTKPTSAKPENVRDSRNFPHSKYSTDNITKKENISSDR